MSKSVKKRVKLFCSTRVTIFLKNKITNLINFLDFESRCLDKPYFIDHENFSTKQLGALQILCLRWYFGQFRISACYC